MEMKQYYEQLAINLRVERARKKLSRLKLSILSNISVETIGQIERGEGNPQFSTIVSIALALDVDLNILLPLKKHQS